MKISKIWIKNIGKYDQVEIMHMLVFTIYKMIEDSFKLELSVLSIAKVKIYCLKRLRI